MKVYRGSAAAARNYVAVDRSRADDYYLAEGSGLAQRLVARPGDVRAREDMDGPTYEQGVAGYDVGLDQRMIPKGRLRTDDQAVRFVEVTGNGPKTWSVAAALHPEIADAYDAAQDCAAAEISVGLQPIGVGVLLPLRPRSCPLPAPGQSLGEVLARTDGGTGPP